MIFIVLENKNLLSLLGEVAVKSSFSGHDMIEPESNDMACSYGYQVFIESSYIMMLIFLKINIFTIRTFCAGKIWGGGGGGVGGGGGGVSLL